MSEYLGNIGDIVTVIVKFDKCIITFCVTEDKKSIIVENIHRINNFSRSYIIHGKITDNYISIFKKPVTKVDVFSIIPATHGNIKFVEKQKLHIEKIEEKNRELSEQITYLKIKNKALTNMFKTR